MTQKNLGGIEYVEFYVANAFQAANFYRSILGFDIIAYGNPKTGLKDKVSYILKQEKVTLIISSATDKSSHIFDHVLKHDDGVKDIAFSTNDVSKLFNMCVEKGAKPILEPTEFNDGTSKIIKASISTFGDTIHSFIGRQSNSDILPFYVPTPYLFGKTVGLEVIDHFAIAMETNTIEQWTDFYKKVFGFHILYSEDVYVGNSGMKSVVVCNEEENIKFVMVEGVSGKEKSQIENYIANYGGAGVQHLAFLSKDIIKTAHYLREQGISFLDIPQNYYKNIKTKLHNKSANKIQAIMELGILFDEDKNTGGYLMQIFSKPLQTRPTFFMEIIQRENANGFGSGNIKSLYEAVQQEQQKQE